MECPNCGENNGSNSSFCKTCGEKLPTVIHLYTDTYKSIAIIIMILGIIGGVFLGNEYSVVTVSKYGVKVSEEFNYYVMIYCWVGTLLFDLFIFGIYSICYRLDLIIKKSYK